MPTQIPVIDLSKALGGSADAKHATAAEIDRTCREIGFFTIKGHGVSQEAMRDLRTEANHFFALPLAEKLLAAPGNPTTPRGYRALGLEALSSGNDIATPPDLKEFYHIGRETWPDTPYFAQGEGPTYFIKNIWPAAPSGFAAAADRYYREVEQLARSMMGLTALALDKPETFFDDKLDKHITAMRLNFYPQQMSAPKPGQLRAGDHVSALATHAETAFGRADILVNNAGIYSTLTPKPFEEIDVGEFRRVMDVNIMGVFLCTRAFVPAFVRQGGGRVVNVSSGVAFKGNPLLAHYVASKGAVISLTRALATELGGRNILVNSVAPGFTLSDGVSHNPALMEGVKEPSLRGRVLARDMKADDLVGAVAFFAGAESAFVTGQTLVVDGGAYFH